MDGGKEWGEPREGYIDGKAEERVLEAIYTTLGVVEADNEDLWCAPGGG